MPQLQPSRDPFESIYQRLDALEKRLKRTEENPYPTVPVYDWDEKPQDAIDGQVARFINVPDSASSLIPYGHAVYIDGQPNTITVPTGFGSTAIAFDTFVIEQGVEAYSGNDGFILTTGLYIITAQAHWGGDTGYVKQALLQGLVFTDVDGSNDIDMESQDIIPNDSYSYVNKISTLFRQRSSTSIVQLAVNQFSGGDIDLNSAVLTVAKLSNV